jgi:hypothetical protein
MWHALRAELAYARPYLFGGLGIAAGIVVLVSVIWYAVGGPPPHAAAAVRGLFPILASMVVCFIVQAYRNEERRARLLLAGPLTPRQLAGVTALLPVVLSAIGIAAAGLVLGLGAILSGRLELESLHIAGFVGGQMFAYPQLVPLVQESVAARGQGRPRAAAGGWAGFVLAILALAVPYAGLAAGVLTWGHLILGHLAVAVAALAASVVLYVGRTDFSR